MPHIQNNRDGKLLYGSLPALPAILGGAIVGWQNGISSFGVSVSVLLALCGMGIGLVLWRRHVNDLAQTKPLGKLFENLNSIGGATVLGSGDVALILDVQGLIQQAKKRVNPVFALSSAV